ncbi:helix-turn-helix transcriptional regulator [Nonomuraea sp. PA05]|uniref:helix-turn-helix domain-containing protein n=1 Tax=Nonomuraea sp. PA05 TaxID=2604466 RepID=UPI0011D7EF9F|nr:helix-turn-helix transcriptional regulator [Nonomuraea sp. PA05]TYB58348.1 helix-turn-helix transcriptional regulator [Nonomuraea sp. PA05]
MSDLNTPPGEETIGRRIAQARRLRGLTQQQLADRVPCSKSLVSQVEAGHKPATQALITAAARALRVEVGHLTGQPYRDADERRARVHRRIPELRRALLAWDLPDEELPAPPAERLRADVRRASALGRDARYIQLGDMLPGLLEELTRAVHAAEGGRREELFAMLAEAYTGVTAIAYTLGYFDLRSLAMDRVGWAATESQDPLRVARTQWQRSTLFLAAAAHDRGLLLLERIRHGMGDHLDRLTGPELSVYGATHLRSAVFAARANDRQGAFEHIEHARRAARLLGGDANHYGLEFGPSNVVMHEVAVAVEMGDGAGAVERARRAVLPPTVAPVRLGHFQIDLARGWLYHGDRRRALEALYTARRIAPQQTRNHPMVRETVRMLNQLERRPSRLLTRFAAWLDMP